MSTLYERAKKDDDVHVLIDRVLRKFHGDVHDQEPSIGVVYASNPKGGAVKLHGYPCIATIKQNSYKDRQAMGRKKGK